MTLAVGGTFLHKRNSNIKRVFIYTPLPDYFLLIVVIHSYCILLYFCAHFLNERSYFLRPTLVHIGIEGGSTTGSRDNGHTSIYFHSFSCLT